MTLKKMFSCLVPILFLFTTASGNAAPLNFVTQDFAPFSYEADGVASGPVAEIIRLVCRRMDITCSFKILPWRRAQKMVKDGEAHGMFPIGWNPERVKWLWFSPPLLKTAYGFFVHGDNPLQFRGEKDVRGYTVGVYGPSNTSRSLQEIKKKIGELTIDLRPGDEAGFRKLACKRIDGVYSNREVGHSLMAKLKLKNIRYAGTHKELKYYVGFSQQHTRKEIVNLFNTTIKMLHQQGAIRQILVKYHMETSFDSDQ